MAKMKMIGAIPSHPPNPPPPSCNASKYCIAFRESARIAPAKNRPRPLVPRELSFHHGIGSTSAGFLRPQACIRGGLPIESTASVEIRDQKENRALPQVK